MAIRLSIDFVMILLFVVSLAFRLTAEIGQRYGPFDWVALDAGQYDSRWANVHMTPEQATQAAEYLRAKVLMPGHIGRFSISRHDWDDPFKRITVASQGRDYALWTPEIGRPIFLDGRTQEFTRWWEAVSASRSSAISRMR
jgi:L-ascorbate metabolism protein UlaG (beta-lactamase superfamily)